MKTSDSPEFDWQGAAEVLFVISKRQIVQFLKSTDLDDLYGIGFFCDPIEGVMLVANTRRYHERSIQAYIEQGGMTDEETFRWDIGNWEYPAGLFPSASLEQHEFDSAWKPFRESLSRTYTDHSQEQLETLCLQVLRRLHKESMFSETSNIEGVIVLGPDDACEDVLAKKKPIDDLLKKSE